MTDYLHTPQFLQDLIAGEHSAWIALYKRHYQTIYAFSYKITQDEFFARNITNDTFLKLYADPSRFDYSHTIDNVLAYLHVIARNSSLNHIKTNNRRIKRETAFASLVAETTDWEMIRLESQVMEELFMALQTLPVHYQDTLRLIYGKGYTYQQAADTLGVSISSIKSYKSNAIDKLREYGLDKTASSSLTLLILYFSIHN